MQQSPIRNASFVAAAVYGHSGEFAPQYTDVRIPGRGLDLEIVRSYRSSLAGRSGEMGRGWSLGLCSRIEADGFDVLYHDGCGEVYRFRNRGSAGFSSPDGVYGALTRDKDGFVLRQRFGRCCRFDHPSQGGRVTSLEDANGNAIRFGYTADAVEILDTLGRRVLLRMAGGMVREAADHAGRRWRYAYDAASRLVEVGQPATSDFPAGTVVRYVYDDAHRLAGIIDAKGQQYLQNRYDPSGRVVEQRYGGGRFTLDYDEIRCTSDGFPVHRTTCRLTNGGVLVLQHDDRGHAIVRTLLVGGESIAGSTGPDPVALVTSSDFNRHSELVERTLPSGTRTRWTYSGDAAEPLNRGNLLQVFQTPAADGAALAELVTTSEYESGFQRRISFTNARGHTTRYEYDDRGNLTATLHPPVTIQPVSDAPPRPAAVRKAYATRYEYNARGQLARRVDVDGSVTEFFYYPADDPDGTRRPAGAGAGTAAAGGYLARAVRMMGDGSTSTGYGYDAFGNVAAVWDGKENPTHVRYNSMGKVERITGRAPFNYTIAFKYDGNYNEVESEQLFQRTADIALATIRELKRYDALDRLVERFIAGGERRAAESFVRDDAGRIVRQVQPAGNVTEFRYDERDLVVERIAGAGKPEAVVERFAYTPNGTLARHIDGNGCVTVHHYDGYQRYVGFTNPLGVTKRHTFDEAGNVVGVSVAKRDGARVAEAVHHVDEWSRTFRVDRRWQDLSCGKSLGRSGWDGGTGIVSAVVEFGGDGLPARLWGESSNVIDVSYDGAGRVTRVGDASDEEHTFQYDRNGNVVLVTARGPVVEGQRPSVEIRREYDGINRLVRQQRNEEPVEEFSYNMFGDLLRYTGTTGIHVEQVYDELGRPAGHAYAVGGDGATIARRFEHDGNGRLTAYVDAAGRRTTFAYDALDRQTEVVSPDGATARVAYDGRGRIARVVDRNGTDVVNRYDSANRLVERISRTRDGGETREQYEYDAMNRLVAASSPGGLARRSYDSLGRVLTEQLGDRVVRCGYDAAGRLTRLGYPGGVEIAREYDGRGRLIAVRSGHEAIATIEYRAAAQPSRVVFGETLQAEYAYDASERLASLVYTRTADGGLLEGFRYRYDAAGRMISEVQLTGGAWYGERYDYDDAGRPVRAEYGVANVLDPGSRFEWASSYEYFEEGQWRRRVDVDGDGNVLLDSTGEEDERGRYRTFGGRTFAYDASGNCISRRTSNPGLCLYTYDQNDRLTKAEFFDVLGNRIQTIEYFYDALGRQVRKVVTGRTGEQTEYTYVWAGNTLLEEYENGRLVRTYVYSLAIPARLIVGGDGGSVDYTYVMNGRGLASGMVPTRNPNAFAERYGYEVTGASFMKEIDGVAVEFPARFSRGSDLRNSILNGELFGAVAKDWENGTISGSGRHLDPMIVAALNTMNAVAGKGHTGVRATLGKQFNDMLGMLGLRETGRPAGAAPPGQGPAGSAKTVDSAASYGGSSKISGTMESAPGNGKVFPGSPQDISWYAAGDGGTDYNRSGGPFDFSGGTTVQKTYDLPSLGTTAKSTFEKVNDFMSTPITVGPAGGLETTRGTLIGGAVSGAGAGLSGPPKNEAPAGSGSTHPAPQNAGEKAAQEAKAKAQQEQAAKEKAEKEQVEKPKKEAENAKKEQEKKEEKEEKKYVDPDQAMQPALPAPEQIEMRLNGRKRPVNPNGGAGGFEIDASSPPPQFGGLDPTVARFDGEIQVNGTGEISLRVSTAPIDYAQDREPLTPDGGFGPTGGDTTTERHWP
ncbi:MAG: DUF6531 domain-containing protein [Pyrinomonadaceae bacterium]